MVRTPDSQSGKEGSIPSAAAMICADCGKEYSVKGIGTHKWRAHGGGKNHAPSTGKNRKPWNSGLSSQTDEIVRLAGEKLSERYFSGNLIPSFQGRHHSEETKKAISLKLSGNNHGGKSKWFEISGQKVQGTWERNFAIELNRRNIRWEKLRCQRDVIPYNLDGKSRNYTPDFYLPDHDLYLEIKGFWWGNDRNKMSAVLAQTSKRIVIVEKEKYLKFLSGELVW